MRFQLVVNPAAGGGRATNLLPAVQTLLSDHDLVVTPTRNLRHAEELTSAALSQDRVVVAMGGDGLVGRVAGVVAAGGGLMAALPGGRGNDFCRMIGIPMDIEGAVDVALRGIPTKVDLGEANGIPFVGVASVGFDSAVQERILRSRMPLGQLVYLYGAITTIFGWTPAQFQVEVDGEPHEVEGWSVVVANSGMYGGGMRIVPSASITDGKLDALTISRSSRLHFLRTLPKVFRGSHVKDSHVWLRPATTVTVNANRPFRVFADGDPIASLPCTITVKPGALNLLMPLPSQVG